MPWVERAGVATPRRTPRRSRHETPKKDRPECPKATDEPVFAPEDFPELPNELTVLPRGRKDRRGAWAWNDQDGEEAGRPRTRSLSRSGATGRSSGSNGKPETATSGRARAMSADAVQQEEPAPAAKPKSCLKTPRSSLCKNAEGGDDRTSGEIAMASEELKAQLQRMAGLLRKSQASSDIDVETALASQLSQLLANMGSDDAGDKGKSDPDEQQNDRRCETPSRRVSLGTSASAPPGSAAWEYPMSSNEKKARVIMLSAMENESLLEELERDRGWA